MGLLLSREAVPWGKQVTPAAGKHLESTFWIIRNLSQKQLLLKTTRSFPLQCISAYRSVQTRIRLFCILEAAFFMKREKYGLSAIARTLLFLTGLFINYLLTCSWRPFQITKCLLKNIRGDVLKKLWNSSARAGFYILMGLKLLSGNRKIMLTFKQIF